MMDKSTKLKLITDCAECMIRHAEELTVLDQAIGDGDHGLNMKRGFEALLADATTLSDKPLPAVASLGVRPTVEDEGRVLLETHIFDYQQDVYGKIITVELLEKIRDEAKYDNLDALTKAIAADAMHARNYFQKKAYV